MQAVVRVLNSWVLISIPRTIFNEVAKRSRSMLMSTQIWILALLQLRPQAELVPPSFQHRAAFGLCELTLARDNNMLGFGADKYR